tara:strand:- start:988 stop:1299 length:312 start_codon:yes stop_codon:yes gene_type:complete
MEDKIRHLEDKINKLEESKDISEAIPLHKHVLKDYVDCVSEWNALKSNKNNDNNVDIKEFIKKCCSDKASIEEIIQYYDNAQAFLDKEINKLKNMKITIEDFK